MTEEAIVRYAKSGDVDIAYKVVGSGPIDLIFVSGFVSHLDLIDEIPPFRANREWLSSFSRVVLLDKRGTGLSDRSLGFGSLAERMDDIRAVMDAAGLERASIYGVSEGGPLALLFTATYPDRVDKLVLSGTFARARSAPDYPGGWLDNPEMVIKLVEQVWGTGQMLSFVIEGAPEEAVPVLARYERSACTPHMAAHIMQCNSEIDVRSILPAINVPTLVAHAAEDRVVPIQQGRWLADHIAGAAFIELPGGAHVRWDAASTVVPAFQEFLLGDAQAPDPDIDRALATVLFTDIVESTVRTAEMGDHRWRSLLDEHDRLARSDVERFAGRLLKTTGDGLLATFDSPHRGIRCADAIQRSARRIGVGVRAGIHTGEVEWRGDDITGLGVVIARRVCDLANDGELLASRTVKDLVTGSGISFGARGTHALKGVPDDWQLFAVDR
jgi:pimeloyl-ACP methyl ester carboxylesterase